MVLYYGKGNPCKEYLMNDISVSSSLVAKDLGVTFDINLEFDNHINNICSKVNSRLGMIRATYSISLRRLVFLYYIKVRPLLEYCNVI